MAPMPITRRAGILKGGSMKHTPGPWKVKRVKETHGHNAGRTYQYIIADDPTDYIAEIFPCRTPLISHGNARLIAAAPDLLEACIAVRAFDNNGPSWHQAMRKIDLAIAKATGEDAT